MTWLGLLFLLVVAALFAAVVKQAPASLLSEPYKSWILWLILVAVVIIIVVSFLGGGGPWNQHIPGTH